MFLDRGKELLMVDLRHPRGPGVIKQMAASADVVIESSRPGVMERKGLGPESLMALNPSLVYTRLTGWGQQGPYAQRAGHDINYLAISGALGATGVDKPVAPPALLGDLAAGSLLAAFGTLLALYERQRSGQGQVVDAAIVDGAALLMSAALGEWSSGRWPGGRGTHVLSGAAPFYGVYRCSDGRWFAVGAIEAKFYEALLATLDLRDLVARDQWDRARWPDVRKRIAEAFAARTRDEWVQRFDRVDACATPVLEVDELEADSHLAARQTVFRSGGGMHAGRAPRLSRMPSARPVAPRPAQPQEILGSFGFDDREVLDLVRGGAIGPGRSALAR